MRVHDHQDTVDFKIMYNAYARGYFPSNTSSYFYEALGDKRHKLTVPSGVQGYLLWTKPDGTRVWYKRGISSVNARSKGYIEKTEFPSGFTLYYNRTPGISAAIDSVSTNTGFQLKYNFAIDYTESYGIAPGNKWHENPPENNATWTSHNPHSVVGINSAVEYCSPDRAVVCVSAENSCPSLSAGAGQSCARLSNEWPTATFSWPKGMPRAVFFGESTYSVTDAKGRVTEINLEAYDKYANENGQPISDQPVGQAFVPRIKSIKPAHSKQPTVSYTYKNHPRLQTSDIRWSQRAQSGVMPGGYIYSVPGDTALVDTARGIKGGVTYTKGYYEDIFPYPVKYPAADRVVVAKLHRLLGGLMYVESFSELVTFEQDYRNFPYLNVSADEPPKRYHYDSRGNLGRIVYQGSEGGSFFVEARYPATEECNNPKTCNKPLWVKDARGNVTHFSYHAESGQVESTTSPENEHGVAAQIRYEYAQHYAKYHDSSGLLRTADDPIWLLAAEKYCINSAYVSGACAKGDEVVTRYRYESDNLFLTSVSVRDPFSVTTRTSCYEYDKYELTGQP